jgi:hypothetical protein
MFGWSQASQARRRPSGESRGDEQKSCPDARIVPAPGAVPVRATATMVLSGYFALESL